MRDVVQPVYIGSRNGIERAVEIAGPVMIVANYHLESGGVIRDCLIHDYTRVDDAAHREQKIIFGNYCIDASGHILDIQEAGVGGLIDDVTAPPRETRGNNRSTILSDLDANKIKATP